MANINLLPWREELRQEKKKEYLTQLGLLAVLIGFVCFLWVRSVDASIEDQKTRNRLLQTEITALNQKVEQIKELKKQKKELEDRMRVIRDLEGRRSVIVHYFDEFAKRIPDGVSFSSLSRSGNTFSIEGVGESNQRIAALMRSLDNSNWFSDPNLKSVVAAPEAGEQAQRFTMTLSATVPDEGEEGQDG
jgi:type IV pilus assembly protein PilN